MHYQDTFWSSDYHTGIKSLLSVLEKGLNEGKASLAYFQDYTEIIELETSKFSQLSINQQRLFGSFNQSPERSSKESKTLAKFVNEDQFITLEDIRKKRAEFGKNIGLSHQKVISKIESEINIRLKDFLEDYKDFTDEARKGLLNLLNIYIKSVQFTTHLKEKFEACQRELDNSVGSENLFSAESSISKSIKSEVHSKNTPAKKHVLLQVTKRNEPITPVKPTKEDNEDFSFPLSIGDVKVENVQELRDVLIDLIECISFKRRMIAIPGINNEYFSSEDLSKWFRSRFPKQDTRRQIEQFGQALINLRLMKNWNKLTQNIFLSDSGYYEFTDLARYTTNLKETEVEQEISTSSSANPLFNITASNTTEALNGFKSRFFSQKDRSALQNELRSLESKYFQSFIDILEHKTTLESSILSFSKKAEIFDFNRIQLLYQLHSLFDSIIIEETTQNLENLKTISAGAKYNDKSLQYSLLKNISEGESGWYWPKMDISFVNHYSPSKSINIFDTDLVSQAINEEIKDPKLVSVPVFIQTVLERLSEKEELSEYWKSNVDIIKASKIKKLIIKNNFLDLDTEKSINTRIFDSIEKLFENFETKDIINFLKVWLLELPDSLIPFSKYDSLLEAYNTNESSDFKLNAIGSIPRQNLATLLYLIAHLSKTFPDYKELTNAQSNIPFIHLIMRPPPKRLHASIDDVLSLQPLVDNLFDTEFQTQLYQKLESMVKYHAEKLKRVEESLSRLKGVRKESPRTSVSHHKSDSVQTLENLNADGLRSFKTTPITSPKISSSQSSEISPQTPGNAQDQTGYLQVFLSDLQTTYKKKTKGIL